MTPNPIDEALVSINEHLRLSAPDLKAFGAALFEIARDTNSLPEQVAIAATELARQGLSPAVIKSRTVDSMLLAGYLQ